MTWVKLDDAMMDHPKLLAAGPTATLLHLWTLCYCARYLTDGFVPKGIPRGCPWATKGGTIATAITALERVGLWAATDLGWQINDYLDYNPSAAQVKEGRAKNAEKLRLWRERKARERNGVRSNVTNAVRNSNPSPVFSKEKDETGLRETVACADCGLPWSRVVGDHSVICPECRPAFVPNQRT